MVQKDSAPVLEVAHRAFETGPWPRLAAPARRAFLEKMALLLTKRIDGLALLETLDTGKPLQQTTTRDLPFACEILRYYAGLFD